MVEEFVIEMRLLDLTQMVVFVLLDFPAGLDQEVFYLALFFDEGREINLFVQIDHLLKLLLFPDSPAFPSLSLIPYIPSLLIKSKLNYICLQSLYKKVSRTERTVAGRGGSQRGPNSLS